MRGVYTASYQITTLTAARTLMYITAPSNKVVEILSASVTNASNETNEQLRCCLQTVGTLGTPTDSAVTPAKHEAGDQAAGSTVRANVTASEPTYTSNTEKGHEGFPSAGGWIFAPTPEERPIIAGGATEGIRLLDAPTSLTVVVRLTFREIG